MLWLGMLAACSTAPGDRLEVPVLDLSGMVTIEEASFEMGHEDATPGPYGAEWKENELPPHEVSLSSFAIDSTEVTVDRWVDFLNADGAAHYHPLQPVLWDGDLSDGNFVFSAGADAGSRPIVQVSWYDAVVFCRWNGKRLPTEAEWELAAKGTEDGRRYPWGAEGASCERAVHTTSAAPCEQGPQPVGSRSPLGDSPYGLSDMAGNVGEWVFDRSARYLDDDLEDPRGPETGDFRVLRGGGFRERPASIRTTARWGAPPDTRSDGVGFRCAGDP